MRIKILEIFFTVLFILAGTSLYYLQIIKGPFYVSLSSRNSIRLLNINAPRGSIYDRHGEVIAGNVLSFGVFIVPQEIENLDSQMQKLADILSVSKSLLERNYKRNRTAPFAPCELVGGVPKSTAISIQESRFNMPGVLVKELPVRNYFYKDAFSHVAGYIGEIDQLELELLKPYGYNIKDRIGKEGIERYCDRILRGKNGGMQIQVDNRGRHVKVLSYRKPKNGKDVFLTIDAGLQREVWNAMEGRPGCAIFMDPHNGEILSLVSSPSYDPNTSLSEVMRQKDSPLLNRAIKGLYPPGSVFKIITAITALESKKINPETGFVCTGKFRVGKDEFSCWNKDGHGYVDLNKAIAWSCNIFFYNTGLLAGADKICEYAHLFGLGTKTGIELFGESDGLVPSRQWKKMKKREAWYAGDTLNLSIGQGALMVTPLQILCMVSAIANRGVVVRPHILKRIGDVDVGPAPTNLKTEPLNISRESIEIVRKGMRTAIEDEDGTGHNAWSEIVPISAKTGTVQIGQDISPHGWFSGFAPSENPQISFVVFLEHGGSGGEAPAAIAKRAIEYWFRNKK